MRLIRAPRQLHHFKRAAQVHVQAALLRFAVERRGAVQDGVGGSGQRTILVRVQPEMRRCEIAAKNSYARVENFAELRKIEMQLQRLPQSPLGLSRVRSPHEQVQRFAVLPGKPRGEIGSDIAGRTGQEDGHIARVRGTPATRMSAPGMMPSPR